ncbi:MAG: hypothetical protein WB508_08970 [Aeromicrobium sp.]|uniref:hypothetical protein n=1 Tax=Aeromicrobium sp. TaxID=1871063 RepID=UPI003C3226AB
MPRWRPVIALAVVSGAAIWLLEPNYLDLQTSATPDEFLGVLGGGQRRAMAAAIADMVFALSYALLGVMAFGQVAYGVARGIGTGLIISAAAADEVENVMVLMAARDGSSVSVSTIDVMGTAGSVKWGLLTASVVLLMALALQHRLADRS